MTQRSARLRHGPNFSFLLAALFALLMAGFTPSLFAGPLDKLKKQLGAVTVQEQAEAQETETVGQGLKEALRVATGTVVADLGQPGGFNLDPAIRIPLPGQLENVRSLLGKVGMDGLLTDLENELNEAAEVATPQAKSLFLQAIEEMTLDDVMAIYRGPDDAATRYFRSKMSEPLGTAMKPIVEESLAEVGAAATYEQSLDSYNALPFVPRVEVDLADYVVDKGLDGIFYYIAREEAAIRNDPVKRTTELLQSVFGD
jgi:hypothetical protein